MPVIVATLIRTLIQAATTTGLFVVIEKIIGPVVDAAKKAVASTFNITEDSAADKIANELIDAFAMIGIIGISIRTKLPTIAAEKLGFTSKGYAKRVTPKTPAKPVAPVPVVAPATGGISLSLGKGILTVTGALLVWNVLTDWVWIGNALNFLPGDSAADIQKRALTILNLIDSPRSIIYSAEKSRRQLSQQERGLIKASADEAEKQITDLKRVYEQKFVLYGRADVQNQLNNSMAALLLELQTLRQMAGLIPRKPVEKVIVEAIVEVVFDGDTIKLDNGETVRLVGIDSPESTTPAGEKAKKYLKARLTGKKVRVESDPDALIDIYGRRLGVVYLIQ